MKTVSVNQKVESQNLYFFVEDEFEENEDFALEAFGVALDSLLVKTQQRSFPTLSNDDYGSLYDLI